MGELSANRVPPTQECKDEIKKGNSQAEDKN